MSQSMDGPLDPKSAAALRDGRQWPIPTERRQDQMEIISAGLLRLIQSFPDIRELLASGQGQGVRFRAEVLLVAGRGAVFRLPDGTQLEAVSDAPLMVGDRVVLQIKEATPEKVVLQLVESKPAAGNAEIRSSEPPIAGARGETINYWQLPVEVNGEVRWIEMEIDPEGRGEDRREGDPGSRFSLVWSGKALGRVRADLHLTGGRGLSVHFRSDSEETTSDINRSLPELAEGLEAAGLKPADLAARRVTAVPNLGSKGPAGKRLDLKA